jgi:hypothetical protein
MKLTKTHLNNIHKVITTSKSQLLISDLWKYLHEQAEIGSIIHKGSKNYLQLTDKDRRDLKDYIIQREGYDPRQPLGRFSRTETAQKLKQEKYGESPFASHLLVASNNPQGIHLKTGYQPCPKGLFLGLQPETLMLDDTTQIVLIENGDTFVQWPKLNLPAVSDSALFIYRGHGTSQRLLKTLLSQASSDCEIVGFFDADPRGISFINTFNVNSAILPDFFLHPQSEPKSFTRKFSKPDAFAEQEKYLVDSKAKFPPALHAIAEHLKANQWAITQEHLIAHNISLTKISFFE